MIFEKIKIKDIGKIVTGCTPSTKKKEYYEKKDYMFVAPADIKNKKYVVKTEKNISDITYKDYGSRFIKKGSIIIDCIGSDMGNCAITSQECLTNQQINAICEINEKIYNSEYIYYILSSMKSYFHKIGSNGSTMPIINKSNFENIQIPIIEKNLQDKITKILSVIDNKIQLNNDINNNLLKIINIEFDNYLNNLESYKELSITEIFDFEQGTEPGSKNYFDKLENGFIKFYRVGDMNLKCKTYIPFKLAKNRIATQKDILVSFDATVGRIAYGINGAYSTGMKKITVNSKYCNDISNSLVFAYFNNKSVQDIIKQHARGTTILHASSSINFMKLKYNREKIGELNNVIDVMFNKMIMSKIENENLINLRDTLLPKLMNGEIDLDNIEL